MLGRWGERADSDFHLPPFPGPFGRETAADSGVKLGHERFVERSRCELLGEDRRFETGDVFREEGR